MNPIWLQNFSDWLGETPLSVFLQNTIIIPSLQSIHIVCVTIVMGAFLMVDLRVLGLTSKSESLALTVRQYFPWARYALIGLFITGLLQSIAEPYRVLNNPTFQIKIFMVMGLAVMALAFARPLRKDEHYWEATPVRRMMAKVAAIASLATVALILLAGRWIAYTIVGS